jgi:hypothetical protein
MSNAQLKLIVSGISGNSTTQPATADPVRSVFDHWLALHNKNPARCKLGPTRRQAIAAALLLYSADDLQLATEGNLIDPWCVANNRHDIDWLVVGESRIERFMELGETLRTRMAADDHQAQQTQQQTPSDPAVVKAHMQRIRAMVDQMKRSGVLHG